MQEWRLRLQYAREKLDRYQNSIWFYPLLMTIGAIMLFIGTSAVDAAVPGYQQIQPTGSLTSFVVFAGSPNAARSILGSIAAGWVTIMGVVFSVTLLVVQLTATRFTSQMLPQFERSKTVQVTLGAFVGTVTYALLVLKTIRTGEGAGDAFVPMIGTNLALVLAIIALLLLIVYISHLVSFVRPERFITSTVETTSASLGAVLVPRKRDWVEVVSGEGDARRREAAETSGSSHGDGEGAGRLRRWEVKAQSEGVLTTVHLETLFEVLHERMREKVQGGGRIAGGESQRWHLRLAKRLGDDVAKGEILAWLEAPVAETELRRLGAWIRAAHDIENQRRPDGDPEYGVVMLRDMGVKAASGGDPGSAARCVAGLVTLLGRLVDMPNPASRVTIHADDVQLLVERPTSSLFEAVVSAMEQILEVGLKQQLAAVPEEVGTRASRLLQRVGREKDPECVSRVLTALLPLYEGSLTKLESSRSVDVLVSGLAGLLEPLVEDGREEGTNVIVDGLVQLHNQVRDRREVADRIHAAVVELQGRAAVRERRTVSAYLAKAHAQMAA